jgi:hypothetical protein
LECHQRVRREALASGVGAHDGSGKGTYGRARACEVSGRQRHLSSAANERLDDEGGREALRRRGTRRQQPLELLKAVGVHLFSRRVRAVRVGTREHHRALGHLDLRVPATPSAGLTRQPRGKLDQINQTSHSAGNSAGGVQRIARTRRDVRARVACRHIRVCSERAESYLLYGEMASVAAELPW